MTDLFIGARISTADQLIDSETLITLIYVKDRHTQQVSVHAIHTETDCVFI